MVLHLLYGLLIEYPRSLLTKSADDGICTSHDLNSTGAEHWTNGDCSLQWSILLFKMIRNPIINFILRIFPMNTNLFFTPYTG